MIFRSLWRKPFALQIQKNIRLMTTARESSSAGFVLTEERGNKGTLMLNRKKALNALNLDMMHTIFETLDKWRDTKSMILMKSTVENVFSTGGDIMQVVKSEPPETGKELFRKMYMIHFLISNLQIPQISILNGAMIGAGASMSIFGSYRVITDKTVYTMPEASIGDLD